MKRRDKSFEEIMDIMAVRIIVKRVDECYAVLGSIHQLYTPLHTRFKDFIATPKSNGYQSLHTTVFGVNGKVVEVQIRTEDMDQTAEIGVAAHWAYKENQGNGKKETKSLDKHISWLRELVDVLQDEDKNSNPKEFLQLLKIDLFEVNCGVLRCGIYRLKNGKIKQLPKHASQTLSRCMKNPPGKEG